MEMRKTDIYLRSNKCVSQYVKVVWKTRNECLIITFEMHLNQQGAKINYKSTKRQIETCIDFKCTTP